MSSDITRCTQDTRANGITDPDSNPKTNAQYPKELILLVICNWRRQRGHCIPFLTSVEADLFEIHQPPIAPRRRLIRLLKMSFVRAGVQPPSPYLPNLNTTPSPVLDSSVQVVP